MADVLAFSRGEKREAALAYARIGWHVFPVWWIDGGKCACGNAECKSPGKHPHAIAPHGQHEATTDAATINRWWQAAPLANVAVLLAKSGLVAVDIDPRNGGYDTIDALEAKHGKLSSDVMAFTGGGGEHRVFSLTEFLQLPGKLGPGVDLKRNGYILLDPSNHASGGGYEWEATSDPREGVCPSPLPDWVRDLAGAQSAVADASGSPVPADLSEMMEAARHIPAIDRDTWLSVGMAFHSTGAPGAFVAWDEWAKTCPEKYDAKGQTRAWVSFRLRGLSGVTKATLFKLAQDHGWLNVGTPADAGLQAFVARSMESTIKAPEPPRSVTALHFDARDVAPDGQRVFRLPGVLGQIQDYYDATAPVPQPLFGVQCALGIASVALGRHFRTDSGNFSSLYFLNITKSANGKEHVKTITERVLDRIGLSDRVAGDGYTSQAGVVSALKAQPVHISIIDEAGKYLEASADKGNINARSANKALMEAIGRCGGVMRSQNYSTMGAHGRDLQPVMIQHPAITLQAMTTPETFYSNISREQISDGFLGRFLICHSRSERVPARRVKWQDVPPSIDTWWQTIKRRIDAGGNLAGIDLTGAAPEPIVLGVTDEADQMHYQFAGEMVERMNELDADGISALLGRMAEFSRRLSMILALAENPMALDVHARHAALAIDYVRTQCADTVREVLARMSDSEFGRLCNTVAEAIEAAGPKGLTMRDMRRKPPCSAIKEKDLGEVLRTLKMGGRADFVAMPRPGGGHTREAWVTLSEAPADAE